MSESKPFKTQTIQPLYKQARDASRAEEIRLHFFDQAEKAEKARDAENKSNHILREQRRHLKSQIDRLTDLLKKEKDPVKIAKLKQETLDARNRIDELNRSDAQQKRANEETTYQTQLNATNNSLYDEIYRETDEARGSSHTGGSRRHRRRTFRKKSRRHRRRSFGKKSRRHRRQ